MDALERLHRFRQTDAWLYSVILAAAGLSLVASFVLSVDALLLAANPQAALGCNINQVLSCGAVGVSWQANLLGFPNAFLGLITEPVFITVALGGIGGARFSRGFMLGVQGVAVFALGFAYWLYSQSMFVIGALCPWCLVVTLSTTVLFAAVTHLNIRDDNLFFPPRVQQGLETWLRLGLDLLLVVLVLFVLIAMVVVKYGAALLA
ncbi:vitamin K epoxide reductase family protein [Propionicimonas sp.]|uniref:vitamin K epoxide reductase family protein n=1 Tax=Propionicimonas sp. TaxID=1955623 RepID=UPI0018206406|nr:vitamin K epoxide reductase family protein [Propionicimonas sp.]MBU3977765.1 vitamin K epoxide reductase family protein [Actinomycetota bacterium]MBA3021688.1 vitamin K epoxide reductase family protein [Propionicimonas sp.]MBU3987239.1 vitamin K epoxide reductase family protein [Actinomycetota bacterium]MBU4009060.1 vitamin K epoxide reductase family protein [Actinomycetota bacterium]MBU4065790.1 vitamin K epoxide reductase family protein [Actinomycetota bacterium]